MSVMLYTGGVRSGKSTLALNNAATSIIKNKIFFATAVAFDDEMKSRIAKHQLERHAMNFKTVEAPYALADSLIAENGDNVAVVDCLTVWLSNQYYKLGEEGDQLVVAAIQNLIATLSDSSMELHIVTNELGWSIVPENAFARRFRDMAGYLNRRVAEIAQSVTMCVCGIPIKIKG